MKKILCLIAAVAALAACSINPPNDSPAQATGPAAFGSLKWTASNAPVTSGNFAAIPAGQPGTGGAE